MSWYQNGSNSSKIQIEDTPRKETAFIEVPSSSPINVQSSPSENNKAFSVPSRAQMNQQAEDKKRELERKRQAIRDHKDFNVVRKRFFYLDESDIFKGFVKGKGNLRDITRWLSENYNREAILYKMEAQRKMELDRIELERQKQESQRLEREFQQKQEQLLQNRNENNHQQYATNNNHNEYYDEDASPIKVRTKATARKVVSPDPSPERKSTKVEINKSKQSILDKYKYKPKMQLRLDPVLSESEIRKKRKLVRASNLADNSGSAFPHASALAENFSFQDGLNKMSINKKPQKKESSIVDDDDLERLEEKIRQNRRAAKANKGKTVVNVSDEDLEEDVMSDDLSEEEEETFGSGLTSIDSQIIEFLNNASSQDLIEISNVPPKFVDSIIKKRPFSTIYEISESTFEDEKNNGDSNKKKKGGQRKTLGMKIIENTENSLKGYKAVESLINKCADYGSIISKQMESWGVSPTGEGELEVVELDPTEMECEEKKLAEEEEEDDDVVVVSKRKGLRYIRNAPKLLSDDVELKNYQLVGVNWLNLLYQNKLSCILADEMGLGKTCQIIAFMAYLKEAQPKNGPHLVIVPASTIENWLREFNKFCPDLIVQAYYGSQPEREELRYELEDLEFDVLVTTYNLATGASQDFKFLRNQNFNMIVYDEGHMLKNSTSERYNKLMRLKAKFRLLLTGTPLQNNLKELVSLLAFMLPNLFNDKREDLQGLFNQKVSTVNEEDEKFNPLLSLQAITKAKTMMTPFVLRRKKLQVLKHLPQKFHEIHRSKLTPLQQSIYDDNLNQGKRTRVERERRKKLVGKEAEKARKVHIPTTSNVMMALRKAALHPLLFRTKYEEKTLEKMATAIMNEPEYVEANRTYILEDMRVMSDYELHNLSQKFPKTMSKYLLKDEDFLNSGKVKQLVELVLQIIDKKEKVLIFSLFTQALDILERVLSISNIKFLRLDGLTSVDTRQDLIDKFYDDSTIPVFLLSTKAGGFGINLVAASNVIIFDQSFNPHDDKQAEDRAHRVGQTKEVMVHKLIAENTIEENMLQLAENKLQLDHSISGNDLSDSKLEEKATSLFEKILFADS
ncbi:uncharacterized protein PRCAT00004138001 [Priceomyces carsonii]|uniref:uncharacterized protein n=1 Tax=Priceomyces carsonii TaxID=28549 RepID=UPI002ED77412|nr:unnamed protein product [Priceomyces carsonii]